MIVVAIGPFVTTTIFRTRGAVLRAGCTLSVPTADGLHHTVAPVAIVLARLDPVAVLVVAVLFGFGVARALVQASPPLAVVLAGDSPTLLASIRIPHLADPFAPAAAPTAPIAGAITGSAVGAAVATTLGLAVFGGTFAHAAATTPTVSATAVVACAGLGPAIAASLGLGGPRTAFPLAATTAPRIPAALTVAGT